MGWTPTAEEAVGQPWLQPTAAGLLALTETPPDRSVILDCPGTTLHILRYLRPTPTPDRFHLTVTLLAAPGLCTSAAEYVDNNWHTEWANYHQPAIRLGRLAARIAHELASKTSLCTPDAAWVTALLTPLGWYVLNRAISPSDAVTLGRKLVFRWRLPIPFAVSVAYPTLKPMDVSSLGGHAGMHRVVSTAILTAQKFSQGLQILPSHERTDPELDELAKDIAARVSIPERVPHTVDVKILARLLRLAALARSRSGIEIVSNLETQIELLAQQLEELSQHFDRTVQDAKLRSLAEFAAGASHEINNPLAIISGNAQLLMVSEAEPQRQKRLHAIIQASARISDILLATRQYARPPIPSPTGIAIETILSEVCQTLRGEAESRDVMIVSQCEANDLCLLADPNHIRQILTNVIKNSIEASPRHAEVHITARRVDDSVHIVVEDAGIGPSEKMIPHLFDPFYSGRDASRGRGLGLAQAWQLARVNSGRIVYDVSRPCGRTRFVIQFPLSQAEQTRRSA